MGVFNGSAETRRAVSDPGTDHSLPPAGALSYGAITSQAALAGTDGVDAVLVCGNSWINLFGNLTDNIHGCLKVTVFENHTHKTIGNYDCTVVGNTNDKRIGNHVSTNIAPRSDIYCHKRTEIHHQPECMHQPTSRYDSGTNHFWSFHTGWTVCWFTGMTAAAGLNLFAVYARAVGAYAQSSEFNLKRADTSVNWGEVNTNFHATMTDIKGLKLKAAGAHLKAMGGNLLAGVAFNTDSPWA